jgi:hypothetical protein
MQFRWAEEGWGKIPKGIDPGLKNVRRIQIVKPGTPVMLRGCDFFDLGAMMGTKRARSRRFWGQLF